MCSERHSLKTFFLLVHASVWSVLCLVVSTQRGARPVSAPVFSQAALVEAGIPMAPFEQPQTSTPIKAVRKEERRLEVTVESAEPSKIEHVAKTKVFSFSQITSVCLHRNVSCEKSTNSCPCSNGLSIMITISTYYDDSRCKK